MLVIPVVLAVTAEVATCPAGAAVTQTLAFDSMVTGTFVDKPPAGPSPGDIERSTEKFKDSTGHVVGTGHTTCVFTKQIPDDMLERCSSTATTKEGTVLLAGVGHLNSMNPPWKVTGRSGAYKGAHGQVVFATDIALDPGVPVAAGRALSVVVINATSRRPLKAGVVPRPAANAPFIRRADAACSTTERKAEAMPPFPFSDFDPFQPDPQVLPQVGQFFNQPEMRALPSGLLHKLERLGQPAASRAAWKNVLGARRTLIASEAKQVNAALAGDAPAFVRSVYQGSRVYNDLVFGSAIFGVQACTFG
jgi:hypothetical protein